MTIPKTRAGWTVQSDATSTTPLKYITGRVLAGDVHTIFDFFCARFERLVEPITKGHSWGWSYRPVRGYTDVWSEHAAAVAIDINAPAHYMGAKGTFTDAQVKGIRQVLAECGGLIVWGGDWTARPDEMHFELRHDPANIARVAGLIRDQRAGVAPTPVTPPKKIGTREGASIVEWMTAQGMDASYANRAKLAAQYGITGYRGTAEQNLTLLAILRDAKAPAPTVYLVTTVGLNIRTAPPQNGKLGPIYGNTLYKGAEWTATGKTAKDQWGNTWVEGRSPWMLSTGQPAQWVNGHYLEEK